MASTMPVRRPALCSSGNGAASAATTGRAPTEAGSVREMAAATNVKSAASRKACV